VNIAIKCTECKETFVFSEGEQKAFERHGLKNQPKRCKGCRAKRRADAATTVEPVLGTVFSFDSEKGFGFIEPDGHKPGDLHVFVHYSAILVNGNGHQATPYRSLAKGQRVKFQIVAGNDRKPAAVNVRAVE
jgi:cold shock CspA family protein